jgi:hypothetical protein
VCYFHTTYFEQDKVILRVKRDDNQEHDDVIGPVTLTMADGSPALTGAFVAGTLGLLLVHNAKATDIVNDVNILQLPYIMT